MAGFRHPESLHGSVWNGRPAEDSFICRTLSENAGRSPRRSENSGEAEHFKYLYKMTLDQKTIIFTNSREETESVLAHLRQLALKYKTPDVYRVHHGNISAVLREQAED